ncbi:DUF6173 family protein [Marivita geojedonensis]|uniref:Uncharacterized protein n=1 Tax=Marivita geojedonensis TaxID=1123756 RepID=A0A1X4NLA1_9RHOB|nr:DUF6173 family protein [Marivita geojedonensis]OSQ51040.1 hypothetical protein MGEO_09970 [Marivita geojedonensis]PRY79955.1 hypothetical protein CLV76_104155 [Marivita geojedonensis]
MSQDIQTTAEATENDALPRQVEAHAVGCGETGEKPLPEVVTRKPVKQKSAAEWAYERLILYIQNFEEQLDNEHEVAMGFAGNETGVLRIEGLCYFDPDILTFYGSDEEGGRMQLIQHVSQLNVALRALPILREDTEPRRIGFQLAAELEQAT